MTFPTISAPVNTDGSAANSTTITVLLPASVAAGDLLIAAVASDSGASTHSVPAGWTILKNEVFQAVAWAFVAYKIATGGETSVVVTKTTERSNALAWKITGWHGTTPPEITAAATNAGSAGPDPGSLTPSWGADDTLWMALAFWDDSAAPTLTSHPTNYTLGQGNDVSGSSAGRLAGSARQLNAASEDPGAFTLSASEQWNAYTLAVRPAAAAGGATATPGTASLALTTFAPVVTASDNKTATPPTAALALTAFAPSVNIGVNVVPPTASLALTTFAPTVTATANKTATPGTAALALTPLAPTVTASDLKTATPGTASLALTPFVPVVTATDLKVATPGTAALALTPFAPVVTASDNKTVTPPTASLALTTFAPTISTASSGITAGTATPSVTLEHNATATVGESSAGASASLAETAVATATVS